MGEVVGFLLFVLAVALGLAFAARAFWIKRWYFPSVVSGTVCALAIVGLVMSASDPKGTRASLDATPAPQATSILQLPDPTDSPNAGEATLEPTDTPEPRPRATSYAQGREADKRDFLQGVDESISGAQIAGNPYKYVGEDVDLHCTVDDIPDATFFNASCGTDNDGVPAIIVVQYDTTDLDKGQSVRVMGTVQDPMEGTNAMGGSRNFPTVKAEFME